MAFWPTLSTIFIFLSAVFVAIGWYLISNEKRKMHKRMMISAAISAILFFIIYISRTLFVGNTSFGGPEHLEIYYTTFLVFHIILATFGAVFGLITLRLAFKRKINKHEKIGPITSVIWFFSAITGVAVYIILYVLYPGGETTGLFNAIFGS